MTLLPASKLGSALYYPFVNVRDETWLKVALLWLDRIYTIVPSDEEKRRLEAKPNIRMAVDKGLIRSAPPSRSQLDEVAKRFRRELLTKIEGVDSNSPYHPVTLRTDEQHLGFIYGSKLGHSLAREFKQKGWTTWDEDNSRWMMNPVLSGLYMTCLAAEMAIEDGIPIVTDKTDRQSTGELILYTSPNYASTNMQNSTDLLLRLGITLPTIDKIESISMQAILEFHEQTKDERQLFNAYRHALETAVRNKGVLGVTEIEDVQQEEWKRAVASYHARIKSNGWLSKMGPPLIATIPALLGSMTTYSTGNPLLGEALNAATQVTIEGVSPIIAPKVPQAYHAYHYLLDINRKFDA